MSAIKGYASQGRIGHQSNSRELFSSVVMTDPKNRAGLDVLPKALYFVDLLAKTAETVDPTLFPGTTNPTLRIVRLTGASATVQRGDVLRFDTAGSNPNMEIPVAAVDGDYIYLAGELVADPDTEDFFHMRHITLTINDVGALSVSSGPVEFVRDAANQQVIEDTGTPANNRPLPTKLVDENGDTVIDNLQRLDLVDSVDGDIIDISADNIPASSGGYLEIVASLAADVKEIHVLDDIGEFIGLYTGAAASETFLCVLPQGFTGTILPVQIAAGTRLSVRNMKDATISTDTRLAINFLG